MCGATPVISQHPRTTVTSGSGVFAAAVSAVAVLVNDVVGIILMAEGFGPLENLFLSANHNDPSQKAGFLMGFLSPGALSSLAVAVIGISLAGFVCGVIGAMFWVYQNPVEEGKSKTKAPISEKK